MSGYVVTTKRSKSGGMVMPTCTCGWDGVCYPSRCVEALGLAQRDAARHADDHRTGRGYFHYRNGWTECAASEAEVKP